MMRSAPLRSAPSRTPTKRPLGVISKFMPYCTPIATEETLLIRVTKTLPHSSVPTFPFLRMHSSTPALHHALQSSHFSSQYLATNTYSRYWTGACRCVSGLVLFYWCEFKVWKTCVIGERDTIRLLSLYCNIAVIHVYTILTIFILSHHTDL